MIYNDDCLVVMKEEISSNSVDLVYLDPPYFTQNNFQGVDRENGEIYEFDDKWNNLDEYLSYIEERLREVKRVLKDTGSIFLHCDNRASHYLKVLMDDIFGMENFRSEIIWSYRRWSNSKKGLLNAHQVILFYSKTENFKFNTLYTEYADSTNVEQMFQKRSRNTSGKSVYKRNRDGEVVMSEPKKGVPLSDVWEIPILNPRAKERTGFPTQKPVQLLERIIKLVTDKGDVVMDPFAGSGTAIVSAHLLERRYIAVDQSKAAIELIKRRLTNPIKTDSKVIQKKVNSDLSDEEIEFIKEIEGIPIRRNKGIDGVLKVHYREQPIFIKFQKENESLDQAKHRLVKAKRAEDSKLLILVCMYFEPMIGHQIVKESLDDGRELITLYSLKSQIDYIKTMYGV